MRLYYKSSVITQRKENNSSKKAVILCVENHSIIKKIAYIIEELFNWYTLKRIVLKMKKRICILRYILSFIHIGIQYTNYSPFSILAFNAARASISPREVLAATLFT